MNKQDILTAIKKARESSKKRKFNQTFDLIINLQQLNLKKPEENVNLFVTLPQSIGKKSKVCALVGKELITQAKEVCDLAISKEEFQKYTGKKELRQLSRDYDYFVAQANLMVDVAKFFGKVLGPKGKMPNPKAGCIVPPKFDLKIIYNKLQKTARLQTKNEQAVKCPVGTEEMTDEQIQENILTAYNAVLNALPRELQNIKNVMIKLTMSSPTIIGEKEQPKEEVKEEKPKKEKKEEKPKKEVKKEEPKEEKKKEEKKEK